MRYYFHFPVFCAVALFALPFSPTDAIAGESNDGQVNTARTILEQALAKKEQFTFSAVIPTGKGESYAYYQKVNPDGTLYRRADYGDTGLYRLLMNEQGTFYFHKTNLVDHAIKQAYVAPSSITYDRYAAFSVRNGNYNGHPCHIVTKTVRDTPAAYNHWLINDKTVEKDNQDEERLRNLFRAYLQSVSIYYIDKENLFIHKSEYYSPNGKLLNIKEYQSLDLEPTFPDDFFKLPSDMTVVIATSYNDSVEMMKKDIDDKHRNRIERRNTKSGIWERLSLFIKNNLDGIMNLGTYFFCIIGAISMLILLCRKRIKKM